MKYTSNTIQSTTWAVLAVMAAGAIAAPLLSHAYRCYDSRSVCSDVDKLSDEKIKKMPQPIILDVTADDLTDTWGEARRSGNTHEGTDIFAERGAFVVMPTDGVIQRVETSGLGGKHIFAYIGGEELLYIAHLDDWADGLEKGDYLEKGELIGYVGNTGADWALPHVHMAAYDQGVAQNLFSRMDNVDWTLKEKMNSIDSILDAERKPETLARKLLADYNSLFQDAIEEDIRLPNDIADIIDEKTEELEEEIDANLEAAAGFELFETDLAFGTDDNDSDETERLQEFLNDVEDEDLDENGEFDDDTFAAVKRFQNKYQKQVLDIWGLDIATGYVGITTRLRMNFMIQSGVQTCPVFSQYNSRTLNTDGNEVEETQKLLKELEFYDGKTDGEWDSETHEAMVAFQEKFAATMLDPWGIKQGTGYKYKTTNKFMNYLRGCDTGAVVLEGRGEFDF